MIDCINRNSFFISDHHFGHNKILDFEPDRGIRAKELGYDSFEDMLIDLHNKTVKEDDIVVFLGDFSFNSPQNWANKLNGKKILILGNHDRKGTQCYKDFEHVVKGIEILHKGMIFSHSTQDELLSACVLNIDNYNVGLCHYAIGDNSLYDRQNDRILPRVDKIKSIFEISNLDFIIHGHLHSQDYTNPDVMCQLINTSCEKIDYTPRRFKELISETL